MNAQEINRPALDYWFLTRYSKHDVDKVFSKIISKEEYTFKITFQKGSALVELNGDAGEPFHCFSNRLQSVCAFFDKILKTDGFNDLNGSILVHVHDGILRDQFTKVPVLTFSKDKYDHYSLLIPDPDFTDTYAYADEKIKIDDFERVTGWNEKIGKAFWRGADSGMPHLYSNKRNPRTQLASYTRALGDLSIVDCLLSNCVHPDQEEEFRREALIDERVPFSEFLKYKYLIDIDGYFSAWRSFFTKLYSKSVAFKVESNNAQWYYHQIIPWVHYIPIKSDFSDLKEKVFWARDHDAQSQQIAENGRKLIAGLTYDDSLKFTGCLLQQIFSCQNI